MSAFVAPGRYWDPEDGDADARIGPQETTADILGYFARARHDADRVIRAVDLDRTTPTVPGLWTGEPVSMRWILIHVLEDATRHAGQMDIIRELIDGQVGQFPR